MEGVKNKNYQEVKQENNKVKVLAVDDIVMKNHKLILTNRESLSVTGVTKIFNANDKQINVDIAGTLLTVEGKELEVTKLDLSSGVVEVFGVVSILKYCNSADKPAKNFLKKVFK